MPKHTQLIKQFKGLPTIEKFWLISDYEETTAKYPAIGDNFTEEFLSWLSINITTA